MPSLHAEVILPFVVLCDNLVLRGLHMLYDHYSEFTKSFDLPETILVDESKKDFVSNDGIP